MPPSNELHVDAVLTNLSLKYVNEELIADMVLPIVKVVKRSNKFFVYDKKDTYKIVDSLVGPKAQPNEVDWAVGTDNYSVSDYALADYVPLEDADNADAPLDVRIDTNEFLNQWLALGREKRVADLVFAAATYAADAEDRSRGQEMGNGWRYSHSRHPDRGERLFRKSQHSGVRSRGLGESTECCLRCSTL